MNRYDEIKKLVKVAEKALAPNRLNEDVERIKKQYGILSEQSIDLTGDVVAKKIDVGQDVEDEIELETEPQEDKQQGYRVSGGIIVLHGKNKTDLELTTDEKIAFQETMDEFVEGVSDLVDFNKLNVYPNNVEWSGNIIDADLQFYFSIGEENGVYINGEMIKADDTFVNLLSKLNNFYQKFKTKWARILAARRKTRQVDFE
jgi:hypothetical protein